MPAGRWATNGACSGEGSPPRVFVLVRVKAIAPLPPSLPVVLGLIDSWLAAKALAGAARTAHTAIAPRRNPLRTGVAPLHVGAGATWAEKAGRLPLRVQTPRARPGCGGNRRGEPRAGSADQHV